jgi:UDP-N-acetylglucosamine 2-epimerase
VGKIAIVLGTRPQIIKCAPVIRELAKNKSDFSIIHTGQHYDYELSKAFFNEMKLPDPTINLCVGSGSHARQTAAMMIALERVLSKMDMDIMLVPGDTNSALAAALTAVKLHIPYAHLEAGPRQFDLSNPEEVNRVVADHLSTVAFAPTPSSLKNLRREGFDCKRAIFTGDTMLDCFFQHIQSASRIDISRDFGVDYGFVLVALHREENTEVARLKAIVRQILAAKKSTYVFPLHPRTQKSLRRFGLWNKLSESKNVHMVLPVSYEVSLALMSKAKFVLTDSGGMQKEAFWLGTPCVTAFKTTPWPETLIGGANQCIDPTRRSLLGSLSKASSRRLDNSRYLSLFGDGRSSRRVCSALVRFRQDSCC